MTEDSSSIMWCPPPPYSAATTVPKVFHAVCQPFLAQRLDVGVMRAVCVALNVAMAEHYENGYRIRSLAETPEEFDSLLRIGDLRDCLFYAKSVLRVSTRVTDVAALPTHPLDRCE